MPAKMHKYTNSQVWHKYMIKTKTDIVKCKYWHSTPPKYLQDQIQF